MMRRVNGTVGAAALAFWGLSGAIAMAQSTTPATGQPETADAVAGRALYGASCAVCHGANLEGQENWRSPGEDGILPAPPHDVTGHTWHHGDKLLFDYTKLGGALTLEQAGVTGFASGMPAFGDTLSDAQIWDILAFIKSTWAERERAVQAERTAAEQLDGN